MIRSVIFDWGGVLIDNPEDGLMEYCAKHLKIEKKIFKKTFAQYQTSFQKGIIDEINLWNRICGDLNIEKPNNGKLWRLAVENTFHEKKDVFKLIFSLRENYYKIGFLSNTEEPAMIYFYDNHYDECFDSMVFSCVEKTVKPEELIYETILKKLNLDPESTIYIDDKKEFIDKAKQFHFNVIQFVDINQLKEELNLFNVSFE